MKTKETKPTTIIELDKIDPMTLPELASFKEKSLAVVKENPYVEIIDNPTYELAKKARTNLRTTRTELQKQKIAIKDKLNSFKKRVENVTAELIAISEPHEIKQQIEVTRYEDIKEQERLEKARIEQERIDGIKTKIKSFADLFNSKIENLTFEGIGAFQAEFAEFIKVQPTDVFQEFEVLYNDMISHVTYSFSKTHAVLIAQEQNRLEQIRLAEERAENERKAKINNAIQNWFNNWSATIDSLSFFNHSGYFNDFQNEKPLECFEFQSTFAERRNMLIQKFESKIALLQQIEDNRIASEKLAKEKADFEIKRLDIRFNLIRKKELAEIGLLEEGTDFKHHSLGKLTSFEYIRNCTEEDFDKFLANTKYAILKEEKANEPVVEEEDFDFDKSYEDAIANLPINKIEAVGPDVVDKEDVPFEFIGKINEYPLSKVVSIYLEHHNVVLEDSVIKDLIKLIRSYDLQPNTKTDE
jgi:hypothetical protein